MTSPYASFPPSAFWSRAVARGFSAGDLAAMSGIRLTPEDRIVSAGSCFASNIVPHLEAAGLHYLRTETRPAVLAKYSENLGYDKFSAAYGNVYTARQFRQLVQRALGLWQPSEAFWIDGETYIDPLRPGLRYRARSEVESLAMTASHLRAVRRALETATVLIFTLGLTEGWQHAADGTVYPACPGTVAGTFNPDMHKPVNFRVSEVVADIDEAFDLIRSINPACRFILTVSPVPLVATFTGRHVLEATIYSKSVLRAAAGDVVSGRSDTLYFPAYEIITGPQAPESYFEADRRNPSKEGIDAVMQALVSQCVAADGGETSSRDQTAQSFIESLSRMIVDAECEEVMADPGVAA